MKKILLVMLMLVGGTTGSATVNAEDKYDYYERKNEQQNEEYEGTTEEERQAMVERREEHISNAAMAIAMAESISAFNQEKLEQAKKDNRKKLLEAYEGSYLILDETCAMDEENLLFDCVTGFDTTEAIKDSVNQINAELIDEMLREAKKGFSEVDDDLLKKAQEIRKILEE